MPDSMEEIHSALADVNGLFEIFRPENCLVLADEMMLSDANGTILKVSESYERSFGFEHNSIVGKSAFDLEADGTFTPCVTAEVIRRRARVTVTQTINRRHSHVMTVGLPLFDGAGKLAYVVCFNTVSMERMNEIQRKYREMQRSLQRYSEEIAELRTRAASTSLIFKSEPMRRLLTLIRNTANTRANVLITGESGVGKSAIAKAIHAMSERAKGPFIETNCAVLQEELIEAELFGYSRGAAKGTAGKIGKIELSNHGTLFLDEIEELPPRLQSRLLQSMTERLSEAKKIKPDFRLIAAANRDLEEDVREGRFRSDLFYSLNVLRLRVPPLRERVEDIAPMAVRFLSRFCQEYGKSVSMSPRFLSFLEHYDWPGNVRELENLMERLVITTADPVLDVTHLPGEYAGKRVRDAEPLDCGGTLAERVEAFEGRIVREAYERLGTTVAVARELGVSQATAARKVARHVRRA